LLWGKPEKTPVPFDAKETTVINDVLKSLYANIDIPEVKVLTNNFLLSNKRR